METYTAPGGLVYTYGGDNANCTVAVCPLELSIYGYRPALGFSSAWIAFYAICLIGNIVQGFRYRTWGYATAMILGCIDEIVGYAGRILYWQDPWSKPGFIIQIGWSRGNPLSQDSGLISCPVCITIGPVFFSAAIYVILYQMYVQAG